MPYKKLNLDRKRIPELVGNALPGAVVQPLIPKGNAQECIIQSDGRKALLHFYFLDDGRTTIQPKVGKNTDLSEIAAKHVAEYGTIDSRAAFSLALRNREKYEVELLIDHLKESADASVTDHDTVLVPNHMLCRMRSPEGDSLVIKFYTNGTLQLQGRPLFLYLEAVAFLSDFLSLEDVIRSQTVPCKVEIDSAQVADELAACLPSVHAFLNPTVIKILSASIVLRKIDVEMDDYTSFVFPALRGLEGYIRQLFASAGKSLPKINAFGNVFIKNATRSSYILTAEARSEIGDTDTCAAIQRCYSLFHAHRHGLFHIDPVSVGTRIISTRQEALDLIDLVLVTIEETYQKKQAGGGGDDSLI